MKVTAVRVLHLSGVMRTEAPLWEERLVRPIDIYPEYRTRNDFEGGTQIDAGHFRLEQYFVRVETDEGPLGIAGPVPELVAAFVAKRLRPIILGQDPIAHEKLWDQMHRIMVHGRQGDAMLAISAVDCALWDLKGRWLNQPVFRLLGGPTRDSVPAYASMLGFTVLDMGRVRERAAEYKALGYPGQKWFFRHGPMSGYDGMHKNIELVRTLRETLGDDYDIMLDCWQSFDPVYAVELADRIAEYRPRWLEECVMPDRIDSYRRVKERTQIPLSGAEPHGHSSPAGLHFSLAQSPILTPLQEFLIKWNAINQHFLAHPVVPERGSFAVPTQPGLGMDLDPAKIEAQTEVFAD
jgi:L-alanine-DL-glutamate epimerase-like enolase superfamily enzyme